MDVEDCVSLPDEFPDSNDDKNTENGSELENIGLQMVKLVAKINDLRTFLVDIDDRVRRMERIVDDVCDCGLQDDVCGVGY